MLETIMAILIFIIGFIVSKMIYDSEPVGCLRLHKMEDEGQPYIFLELYKDANGMQKILKSKSVKLDVTDENYETRN